MREAALSGSCSWEPGFTAEVRHAGAELFVGTWRCPGQQRAWAREESRYLALDLQQAGAHLRAFGRDRRVVDLTVAAAHCAGDEYAMASPGAAPQRATSILVRGELAQELAGLVRGFHHVPAAAALAHARLCRSTDALETEEIALALFASLVPAPRPEVTPARRRLAEEMQHVIATRHRDRITLREIAGGRSPFHAARVFRRVVGETVHRHLNRVRLRAASLELEPGRLTEIALAAGFSSHSHFTHAFRAEFGRAPSSVARHRRR